MTPEPWPGDSGVETASLAPLAGEALEPVPARHSDHDKEREPPAAPTAESEEGVPFVGETERVLEQAHAAAESRMADQHEPPSRSAPPSPNEDVLTVTEKPANPRRGWWQRLIQS